tara:strand:+ start:2679 stop:3236 length:558 start_codon:yes stop_codon:yes gene_type:complete
MFFKKKIFVSLCFVFLITQAYASIKREIIQNLENINTVSFNFEQNINGKIENGSCLISYPKKIYCKYDSKNNKILVSNGNSIVIKTSSSYYLYSIDKTPLNFILDKDYLLKKILNNKKEIIDDKFINFEFFADENEINIFFDRNTYNLIGWQTKDIYQNLSITYLSSIIKNPKLNKKLFNLPNRN